MDGTGILFPISQMKLKNVQEQAVGYTGTKWAIVSQVKWSEKWVMMKCKMVLGHIIWN